MGTVVVAVKISYVDINEKKKVLELMEDLGELLKKYKSNLVYDVELIADVTVDDLCLFGKAVIISSVAKSYDIEIKKREEPQGSTD